MKRYFGLTLFFAVAACAVHAQTVTTTVCNVLNNPKAFDGKMVQIKGTVIASFDQFVLTDENCNQQVNGIWLDYPAGSKGKAGALVKIEFQPAKDFKGQASPAGGAAVTLQKDKEFKQFDSSLSQWHDSDYGLCPGCPKYTVQATVVGRLDGVNNAQMDRDANGNITGLGGFGNGNAYPARLMIQSVSGVTKQPVDYSKAEASVKGKQARGTEQQMHAPTGDPMQQLQKLVAGMQPGEITTQIQKDLALLPKAKERSANGVTIVYGETNEPGPRTASTQDGAKGVIATCSINRGKLDTIGQEMALMYAAQQVEDGVDPPPSNYNAPLYIKENNAWAVAGTIAVSSGEKALILPGGYVMWNSQWPAANQSDNMMSGLNDFLAKQEMLTR